MKKGKFLEIQLIQILNFSENINEEGTAAII